MWERLLQLFGSQPELDQESSSPAESVIEQEVQPESLTSDFGPSTMIGHNYLKHRSMMDDDIDKPKRFVKLSQFLQGRYKDEI